MEYLQQEWALQLLGVLVQIVLSCFQEYDKLAKEIELEMWFV
jgi:hypothetical protein